MFYRKVPTGRTFYTLLLSVLATIKCSGYYKVCPSFSPTLPAGRSMVSALRRSVCERSGLEKPAAEYWCWVRGWLR